MSPEKDVARTYLSQFQAALESYRVPNAKDIAADLRNHILEATSMGKSAADAIAAFGSPDHLARAYALELLMSPPTHHRATGAMRIMRILALAVAGSFLSFCVVTTLGLLGLSLVLGGPALVVGGILQGMGENPWWINTKPLSPPEVVLAGLMMLAIGVGSCWLLGAYIRLTVRSVRKLLPARG